VATMRLLLTSAVFMTACGGRSEPPSAPPPASAPLPGSRPAGPATPPGSPLAESGNSPAAMFLDNQPSDRDWSSAERSIVRLSPDRFPEAPAHVREELARRSCTIPQIYASDAPHNVIAGRFMRADIVDWAALCSRDGASAVLVFPGGTAVGVQEFAATPDRTWLQHIGGDEIGYSHIIGVATPDQIAEHQPASGVPVAPRFDHDGIDDGFAEKASWIYYWINGGWLQLPGAD
jgi:hypothetical protein